MSFAILKKRLHNKWLSSKETLRNIWCYLKETLRNILIYMSNPYPFQIWIAPRNRLYEWFKGRNEKQWKSPLGFEPSYAIFLYPDNLKYFWIISCFTIVFLPVAMLLVAKFITEKYCIMKRVEICSPFSPFSTYIDLYFIYFFPLLGIGIFFTAYYLIYHCLRRPILENITDKLPRKSKIYEKYFKSVPSMISFYTEEGYVKYKENDASNDLELKTSWFNRPVFFNPGKSLHEVILWIGTASFFAGKKSDLRNIFLLLLYYLSHIFVGYMYLLAELIIILIYGKKPESDVMLYIALQSILWGISASFFLIVHFHHSKKILTDIDSKLFSFAPAFYSVIAREGININRKTMNFLHPKITFPVFVGAANATLVALINIIVQS